jgi:hypothetical protein
VISYGDEARTGRQSQTAPARLTESIGRLSGARRRLGHLFELDARELIDLELACEVADGRRSFSKLIC